MTSQRRKPVPQKPPTKPQAEVKEAIETPPEPTGKIFLGEEDKRLLKKFNRHIINKLGLGGNRSVKL